MYTTVERVRDSLPTVVKSSVFVSNSPTVALFIEKASAYIDANLALYYQLPLNNSPMVDALAVDLTICGLLRRQFTQETKNESVWVDQYCTSAMNILKEIREGNIVLVDADGNILSKASPSATWSNNMDFSPTFSEYDDYFDWDKVRAR